MSPYQQEVMDTTLSEFDRQQTINQQGLRDQAIQAGAYGGGREGVMQAQYMNQGAVTEQQLQAQLLNQGFMQAQQAAGTDLAARQGLGQYQQALGQADQGFAQAQLRCTYTCSKRSRVRTIYKIRFSWTTTSTNTTRRIPDYNDRVSTKRSTSKSNG